MGVLGNPALVLNADFRPLSYYPLSLCSWQNTVKSVFLDRVLIIKSYDQEGPIYVHVPKEQQKRAITFLNSYVFSSLEWMVDYEILEKIENIGSVERIRGIQMYALNRLFDYSRLARMIENDQKNKSLAYSINEMIQDLNKVIWKDLNSNTSINLYNRNLQKGYVNILFNIMKETKTQSAYSKRNGANIKFDESDIRPVILSELMSLQKKIKSGLKQVKDKNTKDHLNYLNLLIRKTIENILTE